jgi:hypothetical protein
LGRRIGRCRAGQATAEGFLSGSDKHSIYLP